MLNLALCGRLHEGPNQGYPEFGCSSPPLIEIWISLILALVQHPPEPSPPSVTVISCLWVAGAGWRERSGAAPSCLRNRCWRQIIKLSTLTLSIKIINLTFL